MAILPCNLANEKPGSTGLPSAVRLWVMPMPYAYRHASEEFRAYLAALRDETLIQSDNVIYTGTQAVLAAFRARLTPRQALAFADLLPAVLRAIFVSAWDIDAPRQDWPDRDGLRAEMMALRQDHNFCPPDLLEPLLAAIAATMRKPDLARVLEQIGPEAVRFWETGAA